MADRQRVKWGKRGNKKESVRRPKEAAGGERTPEEAGALSDSELESVAGGVWMGSPLPPTEEDPKLKSKLDPKMYPQKPEF